MQRNLTADVTTALVLLWDPEMALINIANLPGEHATLGSVNREGHMQISVYLCIK